LSSPAAFAVLVGFYARYRAFLLASPAYKSMDIMVCAFLFFTVKEFQSFNTRLIGDNFWRELNLNNSL
jgi:hypothetical protein